MAVVRWLLIGMALLLLVFWWLVTQAGLSGLALLMHLPVVWSPASPSSQKVQSSSVLGPPTVSAAFIDRVLSVYHSPAAGLGQALYDDGVSTGIDPVYALAFFLHESSFGTTGEARKTLALGNERCIPDRPCVDLDRGGYAQMESWEDGCSHWFRLILTLYVKQWHRVTIEQIIPSMRRGVMAMMKRGILLPLNMLWIPGDVGWCGYEGMRKVVVRMVVEGGENMALVACPLCHVLKEQEQLHRCWRCGQVGCAACAHPDRWGDYECQACTLWQRTREVMREPSYDE